MVRIELLKIYLFINDSTDNLMSCLNTISSFGLIATMYFQVLQFIPNSVIEGIVNGGFESFKGTCFIVKCKRGFNCFQIHVCICRFKLFIRTSSLNKFRDHIGTNFI